MEKVYPECSIYAGKRSEDDEEKANPLEFHSINGYKFGHRSYFKCYTREREGPILNYTRIIYFCLSYAVCRPCILSPYLYPPKNV